jgi:acyl-coenzyme A synthetase/AMP-(fatty) acid ligase
MIGNPPWFKGHILPGSVGIPTFMYNMVLLDDEGNEITNPGEIGHIAVKLTPWRPIGLLKGYMEEQRNMEAFKGEYYLTGDKAYFDEKGYWWFVGRADDVIKTSDYRVGPSEVESVLIQHPAIAEIAVVGSPHPEKYQVVKAFIVLKPGYNPSKELALDIFKYAKHQLAYYKIPRILEFVDDFPKTISGKILRRELRKLKEDKKSKGIKEKYEYFYDEFPELKK